MIRIEPAPGLCHCLADAVHPRPPLKRASTAAAKSLAIVGSVIDQERVRKTEAIRRKDGTEKGTRVFGLQRRDVA